MTATAELVACADAGPRPEAHTRPVRPPKAAAVWRAALAAAALTAIFLTVERAHGPETRTSPETPAPAAVVPSWTTDWRTP